MNILIKAIQNLNRCDWYVFFWCIYQMQEILYEPGIINQGIQVLIMGWAIYEASVYMLPQRELPLMLKATSLLMFMYIVYGSIFIILGADYFKSPSIYLKSFLNSFLPLFLFYKYAAKGYLDEKRIRVYFLVFLCMIIPQFYHAEEVVLQALKKKGSSRTEITNNTGYYFVSLFPMLFFWYKNRIIQYASLSIVLLFVLLGMKRGAIGIAGICTLWFLWNSVKNSTSRKHRYQTVTFGLAMVLMAIGAITYQMSNSEYFQERIEDTQEGKTSGRDRIYTNLLDAMIDDQSYTHLLVGRGAYSTITIVHKMAHHDWLETACNNGLLGVFIVSIFFFAFLKTAKNAQVVIQPEYKMCMMMLFFTCFAKTWFSMSLENMPIYVTILIGYLTFWTYNDKNRKIEK